MAISRLQSNIVAVLEDAEEPLSLEVIAAQLDEPFSTLQNLEISITGLMLDHVVCMLPGMPVMYSAGPGKKVRGLRGQLLESIRDAEDIGGLSAVSLSEDLGISVKEVNRSAKVLIQAGLVTAVDSKPARYFLLDKDESLVSRVISDQADAIIDEVSQRIDLHYFIELLLKN